jgi:hypothetical protein
MLAQEVLFRLQTGGIVVSNPNPNSLMRKDLLALDGGNKTVRLLVALAAEVPGRSFVAD